MVVQGYTEPKRFNVNRIFTENANTTTITSTPTTTKHMADPNIYTSIVVPRAAIKRQQFLDPAQESAISKHHKNNGSN
ncbi:hypothetical protein R6Q59_023332 [Mikania micrantha]